MLAHSWRRRPPDDFPGARGEGPRPQNRIEANWLASHIGNDYRGSTVAGNRDGTVPYTGICGESPRNLHVVNNLVFNSGGKVPAAASTSRARYPLGFSSWTRTSSR